MKNIYDKARRYIELSDKESNGTKLPAAEAKEAQKLRRELSARGLDPQHIVGLEYRARVFVHRTKVENFINMRDDDYRSGNLAKELAEMGIKPDKQALSRIIAEIKQATKAIDKKKRAKGVCLARKHADEGMAEVAAEISAEDAELAAAELAAAEKARAERDRMAAESITAFAKSAFGA